jgi:hypothetical protein
MVHVGDREADIYDLFVQPRRVNSELLIRAEYNRKVEHELDYLIPTLEQAWQCVRWYSFRWLIERFHSSIAVQSS